MLIPPRHVSTWSGVAGTRTTDAGEIAQLAHPVPFDGGMASVMLAYNSTEANVAEPQGVRLDFQRVFNVDFTCFDARSAESRLAEAGDRKSFRLSVVDESALKSAFLAGYSVVESEWLFEGSTPEQRVRHFSISFDDFGTYDVLALDCICRTFRRFRELDSSCATGDTRDEREARHDAGQAGLLRDALALEPVSSFPQS